MNDEERNAFRLTFEFYAKWRDTVIETQEQWDQLAAEVGTVAEKIGDNRLGWHLLTAILDTINDLYKDGMKPMPAGYFGRDDL